jgi:hypothetical protein
MATAWWKSLQRMVAGVPAAVFDHAWMSAAEQTRLSWARRIERPADLPPAFQEVAAQLAAQAGSWPYMVLAPAFAGFLMPGTETLVCLANGWLYIVEKQDAHPAVTVYPPGAMSTLEVGAILLKAWITFRGCTQAGEVAARTVRFNAVTDMLYAPILAQVRRCAAGVVGDPTPGQTAALAVERAKFDPLARAHYKFMHAARRSLLPGDEVCTMVMQPAFEEERGRGWRKVLPARHPAHLLILTDQEIIEIADERGPRWSKGNRYGSIYTYIPRAKVAGVALHARAGCLVLALDLAQGDRVEFPFASAQRPALQAFVDSCRRPAAREGWRR